MDNSGEPTTDTLRTGLDIQRLQVDGLTVDVLEGPDRGRRGILSRNSFLIGTDQTCDLRLTDSTVSRRHLMVTLTEGKIQIEDLGSKNGTRVGDVPVKIAFVSEDSRVQVGATTLQFARSSERIVYAASAQSRFQGLIGGSRPMRELFSLIERLAQFDFPVHVFGESGSGKELVARALHGSSPRREAPYRVLDCGSVVPELLPSMLFGHERGAFTGADQVHVGILEDASGGTVVLDEVGEIPLAVQPKLLRALETREIQRLGGKKPIPVDVRIVSSTNRDLKAMTERGQFRLDLYYRLATLTVRVPPLRERREDIALLLDHFSRSFSQQHGTLSCRFSADALLRLEEAGWEGNVRQLRNVVTGLAALYPGEIITPDRLDAVLPAPEPAPAPAAMPVPPVSAPGGAAGGSLEDAERQAILDALTRTGWRREAAAEILGISRTTLYNKIRIYGLKPLER